MVCWQFILKTHDHQNKSAANLTILKSPTSKNATFFDPGLSPSNAKKTRAEIKLVGHSIYDKASADACPPNSGKNSPIIANHAHVWTEIAAWESSR